jgi:hypothetical protein
MMLLSRGEGGFVDAKVTPVKQDWDRVVSELLSIPERAYSSDLLSAIHLVEILRKRRISTVIGYQARRWSVEFHRSGQTGWDSWPVGATGSTLPEACARAAVKLGAALQASSASETGQKKSRRDGVSDLSAADRPRP